MILSWFLISLQFIINRFPPQNKGELLYFYIGEINRSVYSIFSHFYEK